MYIKTFKYPVNNSVVYFKKNDSDTEQSSYQVKILQENLINRYIEVIKNKFNVSQEDISIDTLSTTENNKSYLTYSIIFKTINQSQINTLTPADFIVNTPTPGPGPSPDPDTSYITRTGRITTADNLHVYGLGGITARLIYYTDNHESTVTKTATSDDDGYYSLSIPSSLQANNIASFALFGTGYETRVINLDGCWLSEYVTDSEHYPTIPNITMNVAQESPVGRDDSEAILIGGFVIDDASYDPIVGATVVLSGTSAYMTPVGTITDANGFFYFNEGQVRTVQSYAQGNTDYSGILAVSFVGYETYTTTYDMGGETWWTRESDGIIALTENA